MEPDKIYSHKLERTHQNMRMRMMNCQQTGTHTVKEGDSLYTIARMHHMTLEEITAMNPGIDPYNMQVGTEIMICMDADMGGMEPHMMADSNYLTNRMRLLWSQHMYWTRMLLISIAGDLRDINAVRARLMRNPGDMANLFAEVVSAEEANRLEQLLRQHLQIGEELMMALKNGNRSLAEQLNRQWYMNADEISLALANMNSNFDKEQIREMLNRHLALVARMTVERLAGNYQADIDVFDVAEMEMMRLADYLAAGLQKSM